MGYSNIRKAVENYVDLECNILAALEKLANYGSACSCDLAHSFSYIQYGDWEKIHEICLKCGGNIKR